MTAPTPDDGPTLGQVYWVGSGMRPEAYADIPARSRKQIEAGAAAVAATAIARLDQPGQLADAMTENVRLRKDLADAEAEIGRWPRCPAGCRCRVGTDDADALECGCDGPCTTGWDAPQPAPELQAGPCPFQGHDGEHLRLNTHGHWLCGITLANMLAASDVIADPAPELRPATVLQPADFNDEPKLTGHVSIRFPADMIAAAKQLAAAEGMTVSAWIRREVEREAARREEPQPAPGLTPVEAVRLAVAEDWQPLLDKARDEADRLRELLDEIGVMAANAPEEGDSFGVLEQIAMRVAAIDVPDSTPIDEWPDPENPVTGRAPGAVAEDVLYVTPGDGTPIGGLLAHVGVKPQPAPEPAMGVTVNGEPVPRTSGNALAVSPELGAAIAESRRYRAALEKLANSEPLTVTFASYGLQAAEDEMDARRRTAQTALDQAAEGR
jgi:hypothetical protein